MTTHSLSHTQAYKVWKAMRVRVTNKNQPQYHDYGGRGIRICQRWDEFVNFYTDMGERPEGMSLDRIDNDGDYTPENCRWATRTEQNRNSRRNVLITANGKTMCISEWAEELDMKYFTLLMRKRNGWTDHQIVNTPLNQCPMRHWCSS